jgi:YfiH family protein
MIQPQVAYYDIADGVSAFSTMRHGGVSEGNYGEFNINEYCGDLPEHISENRKALADYLEISPNRIVMPHQVHGTEARIIAEEFFSLPAETQRLIVEGVDTLMTDNLNICIGVSTADCIPILLYDKKNKAVAAVHAGWRGTVARVVKKSISAMNTYYGTEPENLCAIVGPGISREHFEVGDEVYEEFKKADFNMDAIASFAGKWHIDLPLCNYSELINSGVNSNKILMTGICTYACSSDYFSARRLGQESGRVFSGIMLHK